MTADVNQLPRESEQLCTMWVRMSRQLSTPQRRAILAAARNLHGVPYDWTHRDGTWSNCDSTPRSLDCSRFVRRIAQQVLGLALADDARSILDELTPTEVVAGDLVGYGRRATAPERARGLTASVVVAGTSSWTWNLTLDQDDTISGSGTVHVAAAGCSGPKTAGVPTGAIRR